MSRGPMGRNGQFHGKMQKPDGKSLKKTHELSFKI